MDLTQLLPQFGNLAFTVAAFVVALSVIVAIHEYGHYIVGRWTGIHADVFSLGFGPVIYSRYDKRGTRWQIAALPLGGYVKFAGDANAASVGGDVAGLDAAQRRRTMHGAPLWARTLTVAAGPVFNFILSTVIFAGVMMWSGQARDPFTVAYIAPLPAEYVHDLRAGDEILAVAGAAISEGRFGTIADEDRPTGATAPYEIRRDGAVMVVDGPSPYLPYVGGVTPQSSAFAAGVREGDVIMAIDGEAVLTFARIIEIVSASEGRALDFTVWRDGATRVLTLTPKPMDLPKAEGGFERRYLVGITSGQALVPDTERLSLLPAVGQALSQIWFIMSSSLEGMWSMLTGVISTCNLSGPVGIAETSGAMAQMGGTSFIWFLGVLSAAVGFMNLFPVPMLDGGHLVFYAYEAVTRRPPSPRALNVLMTIGIALVGSLMVFALLNDLILC